MSWNRTAPDASNQINNDLTKTKDKFNAIQDGANGFGFVQAAFDVQGNDAPTVASQNLIYAKADSESGFVELFSRNDNGDIVQLTDQGRIGSNSSDVTFNQINIGTDTDNNYDGNSFVKAHAQISAAGTLTGGYGHNISNPTRTGNSGSRTYSFDVDADILKNSNYTVIANPTSATSDNQRSINIKEKPAPSGGSATTIKIKIVGADDNTKDESFNVMVVGGS